MAVLVFAKSDIGSGEIQDDGCASERGARGRRDGNPEILTDFDKEGKILRFVALEQKVLSEGDIRLAQKLDRRTAGRHCRRKLPVFVEFAVVRKKCFGNDSQDLPAQNDD